MKPVTLMTVQEFDDLVQETYKKPYSFQQQDGCRERGVFKFSLPPKYEPYDYENNTTPK